MHTRLTMTRTVREYDLMFDRIVKAAVGAMLLLVIYTVWVTGGTHLAWQAPMCVLGAGLFSLTMLAARGSAGYRLTRDPVFWLGVGLLLLMLCQWLNAGRELLFDDARESWTYGPPPVAWLPSAVRRRDAAEILRWFFPAWSILLCCRVCIRRSRQARTVLRVLVGNAALLSFLALGQHVITVTWQLSALPRDSYFVTSFGYANHAAAFFVLMLFLALGLVFREVHLSGGRRFTARIGLLTCSVVALILGSFITMSVAGIVMAGVAVLLAVVYAVSGGGAQVTALERLNRSVVAVVVLVLILGASQFGARDIQNEFEFGNSDATGKARVGRFVEQGGFGSRGLSRQLAAKLLGDHLWFGTGAWGFEHMAVIYLEEERWGEIQGLGSANVHNDGLQFLAEFGLIGGGLMAAILVVLFLPIIRMLRGMQERPLVLFGSFGLLATLLHSWIDLPFRAPAILYTWLVVLSLLPMAARSMRQDAPGEYGGKRP